jgi:hypothetical protein
MPKWLNILIQVLTVLGSVGAVLARPEAAPVVAPFAAGLMGQLPALVGPFRR